MPTGRLSLPFTFSEVLAEEYSVLKGLEPPPRADPTFVPEDFPDPSALIADIRDEKTALSRYIMRRYGSRLAPETLVVIFNELIHDPTLYTSERFTKVVLSSHAMEAVRLLPQLREEDRVRVHRLLLEEAYGVSVRKLEDRRRTEAYGRLHNNPDPLAALCLSGGGIRSATFALGVLQGLAQQGVLNRFSYLSTVSGGGYVGSWLSAWAYRHPNGLPGVMEALGHPSHSPTTPEPPPVHHLRAYSNYLTPHLGLLSADTWALIGTYVRNVILNWLILVPLLIVAILVSPLLLAMLLAHGDLAKLLIGLASGAVGLTYMHLLRPSLNKYRSRWPLPEGQGSFLLWGLGPIMASGILLAMYAWHHREQLGTWHIPVIWATAFNLLTWFISIAIRGRPSTWGERGIILLSGGFGGWLLWYVLMRAPHAIDASSYLMLSPPAFLGIFLFAATVFIGLASRSTDDEDREWWARAGGWMLMSGLVWIAVTFLTLFGPSWYVEIEHRTIPWLLEGMGGVTGLLTLLLGYSKRTSGPSGQLAQPGWKDRIGNLILAFVTPLFVVILVVLLTIWVQDALGVSYGWVVAITNVPQYLEWRPLTAIMLTCLALAATASYFININKFSLHALYRNRLIRAYLGASRLQRTPNPFTGFDPLDNLPITYLNPVFLWPHDIRDAGRLVESLEAAVAHAVHPDLKRLDGLLTEIRSATQDRLGRRLPPRIEARLIEAVNDLIGGPPLGIAEDTLNRLVYSVQDSDEGGLVQSLANRKVIERLCPGGIEPYPLPKRAEGAGEPGEDQSNDGGGRDALRPHRFLHILNTALNLVKGEELAWQQRKAESMTMSALHAGNHQLGYRSAKQYAKKNGHYPLTLGTAMAISGAAASPNMGYHSSSVVTLLMTLFNVRLGWWFGNPGPAGADAYQYDGPRVALVPLLQEAFGFTDDTKRFVYLSDGGHFENLGLYEMVLRRCRVIVVCDAGHDPESHFEDLGNAIRKIRIDLGILITVERYAKILPRSRKQTGKYCAMGRIGYSGVDGGPPDKDGVLIYIKPTISGSESADIYNYAMEHPDFPHEPTSNQWFNESQFESYRMLGRHIIDEISSSDTANAQDPLHAFIMNVENYLKK